MLSVKNSYLYLHSVFTFFMNQDELSVCTYLDVEISSWGDLIRWFGLWITERREFKLRMVHNFSVLCGSYTFPCARVWKLKQIYIAGARAQFKINTGVEINICSFQMGCQLSNVSPAPPLELYFGTVSVAWNEIAGRLEAGDVASVWMSCVQSPAWSTIIYRRLCGSYAFPMPEHRN